MLGHKVRSRTRIEPIGGRGVAWERHGDSMDQERGARTVLPTRAALGLVIALRLERLVVQGRRVFRPRLHRGMLGRRADVPRDRRDAAKRDQGKQQEEQRGFQKSNHGGEAYHGGLTSRSRARRAPCG